MSYEIGYEPFSGPEQVWTAAGWFVIVQDEKGQVNRTIACHRATGKIIPILIDLEIKKDWLFQTIEKIIGARS